MKIKCEIKKIPCLFGLHKWIYFNDKRLCYICGKRQRKSYDMLYGQTIWGNY